MAHSIYNINLSPRGVGVGTDVEHGRSFGQQLLQPLLPSVMVAPSGDRDGESNGHEGVIPTGPAALVGLVFLPRHFEAGYSLEAHVSLGRRRVRVNVPYIANVIS